MVLNQELANAAYTPRRLGLLPINALEQLLELRLKSLVLGALIELAEKIAPGAKSIVAERQRRETQILLMQSALCNPASSIR